MYTPGRSSRRSPRRVTLRPANVAARLQSARNPSKAFTDYVETGRLPDAQLEGISFDFLKKAIAGGAKIVQAGAAAKKGATHVAGEVRKIADKVDRAGAGVQRVAQQGRDAADSIESAGRAAEGAAQGAVAGASYGGVGKSNALLLGIGIVGAIGLVAYTLGRSR